jgi:hypothetical protein
MVEQELSCQGADKLSSDNKNNILQLNRPTSIMLLIASRKKNMFVRKGAESMN